MIYKYEIKLKEGRQTIRLPRKSKIIHIGMQGELCYVWVDFEDNDDDGLEDVRFLIKYTGAFSHYFSFAQHLQTIVNGDMVYHIYGIK